MVETPDNSETVNQAPIRSRVYDMYFAMCSDATPQDSKIIVELLDAVSDESSLEDLVDLDNTEIPLSALDWVTNIASRLPMELLADEEFRCRFPDYADDLLRVYESRLDQKKLMAPLEERQTVLQAERAKDLAKAEIEAQALLERLRLQGKLHARHNDFLRAFAHLILIDYQFYSIYLGDPKGDVRSAYRFISKSGREAYVWHDTAQITYGPNKDDRPERPDPLPDENLKYDEEYEYTENREFFISLLDEYGITLNDLDLMEEDQLYTLAESIGCELDTYYFDIESLIDTGFFEGYFQATRFLDGELFDYEIYDIFYHALEELSMRI